MNGSIDYWTGLHDFWTHNKKRMDPNLGLLVRSCDLSPADLINGTMTPDENFIDFNCPYCNEAVSFPQDSQARVQECPNCAESLILPNGPDEPGKKIPLPITTPRLTVRRLATADWKDLLEFLSDEARR